MESLGVEPLDTGDIGMFLFSSIGQRTFAVLAWVFISLAAWSGASAQSGDSGIVGTVVSGETGDPVPFATIRYFPVDAPAGQADEATSLGDGTFRISVAPGTYRLECSHPSFAAAEASDVEVAAGSYVTHHLALSPAAASGVESIEVKARRLDNSPAVLLSKQQRAPAVSDGISAEQIRRSTDSNAAEALARVTGMSVVSNGYVFVRGLGERYSQSTINGNMVGSPDPNKRVLPMDLFPASLLDNVVVQKTYTPDQPGDFSGGVVDIRTVTFPLHRTWSFSVAGARRGATTGEPFSTYQGGEHDYWGFSDSFREIPATVTSIAGGTKVTPQSVFGAGFSPAEITEMGRSFNKVWSPTTDTAAPAHDYSASYGDEVDLLGCPLGFVGSFSLTHGFEQTTFEDVFYESVIAEGDSLSPRTDYAGTDSEASTLWGGVLSAGYRVADAHKVVVDALYTRNAEDQVRQYEGENNDTSLPARVKRLKYHESGVFVGSAGMNHVFPLLGNAQLDWNVNYSEMEHNEPDRREYLYELFDRVDPDTGEPFQQWELTRRSTSLGLTRLYYGMKDYDRGGRADLTVPFRQWHGLESKVKVGGLVKNKDRSAEMRRFGFKPPSVGAFDYSLSPEELLVDANIGGDPRTFNLSELTRGTDGYRSTHDIQAAYGMIDLPLVRKLRMVAGVRVEDSQFQVITEDRFDPSVEPIIANLDETDLLPSVNATYAVTDEMNLRAAYSRTLARPDIRELTPFEMPGFVGGPPIRGNEELTQSDIRNYDLRAEWYPGRNQLLAVSGFYKDFKNAIEYAIGGTTQITYVPQNGDAFLYGAELEARIGLDWLASSLSPFSLNTNLSLVKSEATIGSSETTGLQTSDKRPLQGQSPYIANAGLFYSSSSLSTNASVLYNVFGERIDAVGMSGVPDVYEQPRHTLDATASYSIGGGRLKLSVENLLDEESLFTQEISGNTFTSRRYKSGRSVSLSLSVASS
jgi:outer membrane receptor protein involved in Fe transport